MFASCILTIDPIAIILQRYGNELEVEALTDQIMGHNVEKQIKPFLMA